ncbi:FecR domain-containing protein [Methylomonas sp. DH-1]|uniref:FecR family protein n=1 Tax=Methylomonas sp. (strain DH-1) TaxID=1727196 RepID=UPI0007C97B20|nr:FecR domain-containing protein [Methylomonas sp. DH-1]ANE54820.1 hypothetical protein AYM39_06255 [Methylomonas sp. DH-1]
MKSTLHLPAGNLQQQAGYWVFAQHNGEWTSAAESQLQAWLAQSDAHRHEYQRALQLWQRLDQFKAADFPLRHSMQRLRAKNLKRRQCLRAVRRHSGTALLVMVSALSLNGYLSTDHYRTAIGQRQSLTLADGSQLVLNTDSQVSVKIGNERREVWLERGEAFFHVAHQADRPFEVVAGNVRVRDIGTGFNVSLAGGETKVTVTEGEVAVHPDAALTGNRRLDRWLHAGRHWLQTALALPDGGGVAVTAGRQWVARGGEFTGPVAADTGKEIAWRDGRAVFELATLEEVLVQVARYHPVEFEFADPDLQPIRVSASFDTGNLAVILNTLQATFPISIKQIDGRRFVVSGAKKPA